MNDTPSHENALTAEPTRFEMIPHWIMDHPDITPNAIRLYLQLRRYTGKEATAFPSRKRLAQDLNITVPTVDTAKKVLIDIGAITVKARYANDKDRTSNLYLVKWSDPSINTLEVVKKVALGSPENDGGVAKKTYLGSPENEGSNLYPINLDPENLDKDSQAENLPEVIPTAKRKNLPRAEPEGFAEFYAAYPKRVQRAYAVKAWMKAVLKEPPENIISAARVYALSVAETDPQFIPHPATWLNAEQWADEIVIRDPKFATNTGPKNSAQRRMDQYEELLQNIRARGKGAINE